MRFIGYELTLFKLKYNRNYFENLKNEIITDEKLEIYRYTDTGYPLELSLNNEHNKIVLNFLFNLKNKMASTCINKKPPSSEASVLPTASSNSLQ